MNIDTVTLFFAMLAVLAAALTVGIAGSAITGDRFGLNAAIGSTAVEIAAAIAVTATLGSLYLSEVQGYEPCRLCWVQRGFMYPAAVLLVISVITKRMIMAKVAGGLALIGLSVAVFHRYEQAAGDVGGFCDADNPCTLRWVEEFGFITIPTMAAAGFAAIIALTAIGSGAPRSDADS